MTEDWRLLIDGPATGAWNMAVDEAIFRVVEASPGPPTLRLYRWAPPAVSLGFGQSSASKPGITVDPAGIVVISEFGEPVFGDGEQPDHRVQRGTNPAGEHFKGNPLAGTNVSALVLELPITALSGAATSDTGVIRAWATTERAGLRVDRMAIPAINTALIPSDQKDAFNQGDPADDSADFGAVAEATISGLRAALEPLFGAEDGGPLGDLDAATVAGALIPDVVTIDFSAPVVFPNGRQLSDDVIDVALGIVLNRGGAAGVSDAIDGNDVRNGCWYNL